MKNYGLKVNGVIRVFSKTKEVKGKGKKTYNITDCWVNISEKEEDGSYFNKSMNLIFKKDAPRPDNNTVINILDGSFMITGNDDYRKISIFVRDWEVAAEESADTSEELPFN